MGTWSEKLTVDPCIIKDKVFTHSPKGFSEYAKRYFLNQIMICVSMYSDIYVRELDY